MRREQNRHRMRLLGGLMVVLACGCSRSSPNSTMLIPTFMTATGPNLRTPDGAVTFWGNGALHARIAVEKGPISITVHARGNRADGEAPVVRITLADRELGTLLVDSTDAKEFTLKAAAERTESAELTLWLDNYVAKDDPLQSRWLVVDAVTVRQEPDDAS